MIDLAPDVAAALAAGGPLVALETTAIAHGLPWPDNLAVAHDMEAAVRAAGAVPASIAVLDGRIRVGLTAAELERVAHDHGLAKLSWRDLPVVLARGGSGATTVAGTLAVAGRVGIQVFATGGLGGVHPGAEATFDVSADLGALARTPCLVVCAGAKSLLDLARTLELLETLGVPVLGLDTDDFPAFYTRRSGLPVAARVECSGAGGGGGARAVDARPGRGTGAGGAGAGRRGARGSRGGERAGRRAKRARRRPACAARR